MSPKWQRDDVTMEDVFVDSILSQEESDEQPQLAPASLVVQFFGGENVMNLRRVFALAVKEIREITRDRLLFTMAFLLPPLMMVVIGFWCEFRCSRASYRDLGLRPHEVQP